MSLKHFFPPSLITGLENESQGSSLCIRYIYSFFQDKVVVSRFGWQVPFVHHVLLLQGGQKEERREIT